MPLLRGARPRKRWRYVAVFEQRLMLCAARVEIGPLRQSFWAIWDRESGARHAHTSFLRGTGDVDISDVDGDAEHGADGAAVALRLDARGAGADLRLAPSTPIEALCPSGESGYGWTRKRAGMSVEGTVAAGGRSWALDGARGVDDASAGYHQREIDWVWSAGVGEATDGRQLAWNLVTGINDPPRNSERAIWVDGQPSEPGPVSFDGLDAIRFDDGSRAVFHAESERARSDNLLVVRSRYRHLFGSFAGSLGGIELASGLGVMEEHSAVW
jgi:hypothetical protein